MKRMTLIAAALCLIMLTTVGAGTVAAKQANPRHAGASSIYFFDVPATSSHGRGTLMINVKEHTFVFNGKGFDHAKTYYLEYRLGDLPGIHTFASGKTTHSGNVHIGGTWTKDLTSLPTVVFSVTATPPLAVTLHSESTYVLYHGEHRVITNFTADVTQGSAVHYTLVRDDTGVVLYDGSNPNLGGATISYPYGSTPPTVTLTAYDGAGNTATDYWPKT